MKRVLIANRGEIAVRIIRACRELGLETVAVYSEADAGSLPVKLADYASLIGGGPAVESYLRKDRILEAAKKMRADALHPGYGLLSENAEFAKQVGEAGIKLIGPSAHSIAFMGEKTQARDAMKKAGIPVVPGSDGALATPREAEKLAAEIGFPVLIKAVSGGGGRGMRVVRSIGELAPAFESASREAAAAFGNGSLYLEKYLENPRHVEIQILADAKGHTVYLGERECSIQRRHQKIIEESPCTVLTEKTRTAMGECAVNAAKAVRYEGVGTVEFLLDKGGKFYFIEMNTRLQVEHPVTEMIFGIDLVVAQIQVAMGQSFPYAQGDLKASGAALECRICAEDPEENYRPSPGTIEWLRLPGGPGVRFDSHIYAGYEIPVFYDPLIGKLITWGENRLVAVRRMKNALHELQISGVRTNIPLLRRILENEDFEKGRYDTHFLERHAELMQSGESAKAPRLADGKLPEMAAVAVALREYQREQSGVSSAAGTNGEAQGAAPSAWKNGARTWNVMQRRIRF